jgi:signal transduction histidine kinase
VNAVESLHILVVDDELGMRHSVTRALERWTLALPELHEEIQFVVDSAASGEEALTKIGAVQPDLVLLDHKMGGMSGIEVLERLRQTAPDVLVIMITAFATIDTAVRATKNGAFDFLAKPFTPDELKETVRKAVQHLLTLRQARRLAHEKRRVRFEFIRMLGHELKAPLGAIESYLAVLKTRAAGNDLAAYDHVVSRCLARAEGMRKLINDLLDLTRIEAGEKRREIVPVDLRAVVESAFETHRPAAEERKISLSLEVEGEPVLPADRSEMDIVASNLISNAIKYNREGGSVVVRIAPAGDGIRLSVTDTGIGLTAEEAGRLFKDFVRIRNAHTRNISGSGLGLSIVRKIAELYGGDVDVSSQPGVGSTFSFFLRAGAGEESGDAAQRAAPVAS